MQFLWFSDAAKIDLFQLICLSSFTCLKRLSVYPSLPKSGLCLFVFCQPLIGIFSFAKVFDLPLRKDRKPERVWEWESKTQLLYYDVFENFCHYFVGIVFQFFTFEPQASKFFSGKLILAGDIKVYWIGKLCVASHLPYYNYLLIATHKPTYSYHLCLHTYTFI